MGTTMTECDYRALFDSIDEGFVIAELLFDHTGKPIDLLVLETNPSFDRLMRTTNAVGRHAREIFPFAEQSWFDAYGRVVETGESLRFENYLAPLDSWFELYVSRVGDAGSRRFVIVFSDVTSRKRGEAALRQSERRYRTLVDYVLDYAIFAVSPDGIVTEWSRGAERVNGYTATEAIGRHIATFHTPDDAAIGEPERELSEAAAIGRSERQGWRLRKDGARFWADEIVTAVRDAAGRLNGFTAICRDLTEHRLAAELAARAFDEQQRDLLRRRLSQAEDEERRRLSRELHDTAAQHLTALGLGLDRLSNAVAPDSAADRLAEQLRVLVSTLGRELHDLAVWLRPKALDDFGLAAALTAFAQEWSDRSGVKAEVHASTGPRRLPATIESAIYRIVQEALTNVARHSGADRVSVLVERRNSQVIAIVEDDGRGFDPSVPSTSHEQPYEPLGLRGVQERVAVLGGTVEIESSPSAGTTLFVRIPVEEDD